MLAKRIIPCLDVNHGRVVKGKKFHNLQDVDDPVTLGKYYSESGADELVFYDITATHEGRETFVDTVRAIAEELTIPLHGRRRDTQSRRFPYHAAGRSRQSLRQFCRCDAS